ncbi:hypothetical protein PFISCL1PPCAC_14030 [Pristionchus fissidentatus]|uniref:Phosphatidic acid phosphatase type 2/haloperoxidase domain-containing protein n=1 Tax=Pristionchus fissidentatus TaxID=1538716 RepID=A0AAV5VWJ0_9BILA|nr:hypothetical protein PFISCL1PPCAC_14030 [Pristionchus fissidentatus]
MSFNMRTRELSIGAGVLNFVILYAIAILLFVVPEKIGPYQRGFYCDDESIRFETKPNTVLIKDLFIATFLLSFLIIFLCELFLYFNHDSNAQTHYKWFNFRMPSFLVQTGKFYGYYHAGFVMVVVLTQIPKYIVGRMRPHFMDVCRPTPGYVCMNPHEYVTNYTCIEPTDYKHAHYLLEARMSFFSGHAAASLYFAVVISLYLQSRLAARDIYWGHLQKFQISLVIIAILISYTRIMDNFHHPSDVVVGLVCGAIMGYLTVKHAMGLFIYKDGHIAVKNPEGMKTFANFVAEFGILFPEFCFLKIITGSKDD